MLGLKKLPVGFENFQEIRKLDCYYVDKTKLIEQLLENWSKVNLFTRPRRFGKTLHMSMLKSFFEIGTDATLFEGLYISHNKEFCREYMGKYPVVCLSLKGIDGSSYEAARYRLIGILKNYSGWAVKSNKESGDGFADILLKPKNPDVGIVIELKYARSMNDLDKACERAMEQIKSRRYDTELLDDGRNVILVYGIAFCKKRCKVVVEKL